MFLYFFFIYFCKWSVASNKISWDEALALLVTLKPEKARSHSGQMLAKICVKNVGRASWIIIGKSTEDNEEIKSSKKIKQMA